MLTAFAPALFLVAAFRQQGFDLLPQLRPGSAVRDGQLGQGGRVADAAQGGIVLPVAQRRLYLGAVLGFAGLRLLSAQYQVGLELFQRLTVRAGRFFLV
jgi:hypothetical protein